jgi:hypothetical protein
MKPAAEAKAAGPTLDEYPRKGLGAGHLIFESANGSAALTLPILRAVAACMHPVWVEKGLALIEALDHVDLVGLNDTLRRAQSCADGGKRWR